MAIPVSKYRKPIERPLNFVKKNWGLILSIVFLWLVVAICIIVSMWKNQGHIGYALDDAYIHMAISKNIAQHGIWGVTNYEFSSASSSILWSLLLAILYYLFGNNELIPLILNIIFSSFIVLVFYYSLKREKCNLSQVYIFFFLVLAIFATPMAALIFGGMEHVLQGLICLYFCYLSAKVISEEIIDTKRLDLLFLLFLSALVTAVRYEGIFLIFVVFCLFLFRQRYIYAFSLGTVAVSPIIIFGIYSIINGGLFLPNSVLLKGSLTNIASVKGIVKILGGGAYSALSEVPHLLFLLLVASFAFFLIFDKRKGWKQSNLIMLVIFIFTTLIHLNFAKTGWFYRYEAYLVLLGVFVVSISLARPLADSNILDRLSENKVIGISPIILLICCLLMIHPFFFRSISILSVPQAITNIYQQQYQMGLFVKKFYPGDSVAANDIGAISYLAEPKLLDMVGLGSNQVTKYKRSGEYNTETISRLSNSLKTRIAIIYDHWFDGEIGPNIPENWIKAGSWTIKNNVVAAGDTVSFYGTDIVEKNKLVSNLESFTSELPFSVEQRINQTDS